MYGVLRLIVVTTDNNHCHDCYFYDSCKFRSNRGDISDNANDIKIDKKMIMIAGPTSTLITTEIITKVTTMPIT